MGIFFGKHKDTPQYAFHFYSISPPPPLYELNLLLMGYWGSSSDISP